MIRIASISTLLGAFYVVAQTPPPSNLPPTTPGVFTSQSSIIIGAPIAAVWETLLDFPSYPQWNPFVRAQIVTNAFFIPTADQTPHENLRLIIQAQIPPLPSPVDENTLSNPLHAQISFENITVIDAVNHRAAWRQNYIPESLLVAERWQALSVVDETTTFYEAREVFRGPVGYVVNTLFAQGLQEGFDAQAAALKDRLESST